MVPISALGARLNEAATFIADNTWNLLVWISPVRGHRHQRPTRDETMEILKESFAVGAHPISPLSAPSLQRRSARSTARR